jgi:hypothetical protein
MRLRIHDDGRLAANHDLGTDYEWEVISPLAEGGER